MKTLLRSLPLALLLPAAALASEAAAEEHGGGINFTFIATIVNFAILAYLLFKPLRKALTSSVEEKHDKVSSSLASARGEIAKAREKLEKYRALLDALPEEIKAYEAESKAELAEEKVRFDAELSSAQSRIEQLTAELVRQETAAVRDQIVREVAEQIAVRAEAILRARIDKETDEKIVASVVHGMEAGR